MKKFYRAYEAAEYAAKITDVWKSETDEILHTEDLLGYMSVADEHETYDEDDETTYYVVNENGSVGFTNDGGKMILWIATAQKTQAGGKAESAVTYCSNCGTKLSASASFCTECGQKIEKKPDEIFCTGCGTRLANDTRFCPECGKPVSEAKKIPPKSSTAKKNIPDKERPHGNIGYSDRINAPEFIEGVNKGKKARRGCAVLLYIAPIIIVPVYSFFSDGLKFSAGLLLGLCISAMIFLISNLASMKERFEKPFDGIVERQYEKEVRKYREHRNDDHLSSWETRYITVIRKDGGGKHTIEEKDTMTYSYLKVGDRVRYHGKMGLLYPYEKYDKSHDEYVICAFCRKYVPITDDTCPKCKRPILK